jgi:hypothetical protein
MGVIFLKRIKHEARGSLGPDEIRIAVTAYEAALKLIGGAAGDDGVRDTLASYIIQSVLDGARDEVAVRESAIGSLTGMKQRPSEAPSSVRRLASSLRDVGVKLKPQAC